MTRSFKLLLVTTACFASLVAPSGAATVVNGGFESGLGGWTTSSVGTGVWLPYSAGQDLGGLVPPQPRVGSFAAVTDMSGPSSVVLFQDVALEPGHRHSFSVFRSYYNDAPNWSFSSPLSFSVDDSPNQHFSINVLRGGADPRSANPADVLAKVDAPVPSSPLETNSWDQKSADLSAFAGQTVRLRFVVVDTEARLHLAIDDAAISSVDIAPPAISNPSFSGGKFKFTSDSAGSASITVTRQAAGKRSGKRCVKPTSRNRSKRNCKRWLKVGKTQVSGVLAGSNAIAVKTSSLKPGRYRVTMVATDASGLKSKPVTKSFTIRKKKRR